MIQVVLHEGFVTGSPGWVLDEIRSHELRVTQRQWELVRRLEAGDVPSRGLTSDDIKSVRSLGSEVVGVRVSGPLSHFHPARVPLSNGWVAYVQILRHIVTVNIPLMAFIGSSSGVVAWILGIRRVVPLAMRGRCADAVRGDLMS
ncbi:hypothetical protein GCM10027061_24800 [Nesterenkonia suensis]